MAYALTTRTEEVRIARSLVNSESRLDAGIGSTAEVMAASIALTSVTPTWRATSSASLMSVLDG